MRRLNGEFKNILIQITEQVHRHYFQNSWGLTKRQYLAAHREPGSGKTFVREEDLRATEVLNSLICKGKKSDGRIRKADLINYLDTSTGTEHESAVTAYLLGRRRPEIDKAWEIGDALYHLGAPWCNGLWMLWAMGHLDDAYGCVAVWVRDIGIDPEGCDALWHALALSTQMAATTMLDATPPFAEWHIRKSGLDKETMREVTIWAAAQEDRKTAAAEAVRYMSREVAKGAMLHRTPLGETLDRAFRRWSRHKSLEHPKDLDRVITAAMAVTRSPDVPLRDRELASLALYGHWLNCLEKGVGITLYPRPVRQDFQLSSYLQEP